MRWNAHSELATGIRLRVRLVNALDVDWSLSDESSLVNEHDILTCAEQAAEWLLDRRERLEKHEHESTALLWLSISEIAAIIDSFDTLQAMHGLTLDERVLRDDLIDWIGGSDVDQRA
jgi:hypothetical protein